MSLSASALVTSQSGVLDEWLTNTLPGFMMLFYRSNTFEFSSAVGGLLERMVGRHLGLSLTVAPVKTVRQSSTSSPMTRPRLK